MAFASPVRLPARVAFGVACLVLSGERVAATEAPHGTRAPSARPQEGVASYYRPTALGGRTASGEAPKAGALTAASKTLPLGSKAKVTNTDTGRSVKVTVTDRGPFVKGRILDVSPRAADKLGMKEDGVAPVKVKPLAGPSKTPP